MGRAKKGQRKVTTIWLEPEIGYGGKDELKLFKCFNCGVPVMQYSGYVKTIVPGKPPMEPASYVKCKGSKQNSQLEWENCGHYFSFVSSVYTRDVVEV